MDKFSLTLLAALAALPTSARGDGLRATLGQDVAEVSHTVNVELSKGIATLKVRRTFANRGSRHDEAHLTIKTPPGAAATGLRIRAGKRWYDGELMRADKARAMYEKLTGMGKHRVKDPALLQWNWADQLELFVFPIAPGKASTVEYTFTVPTEYQDGRYYLSYPRTSKADNLVMPSFRLDAAYGTEVFIDDRPVAPRQPTIGSKPSPLVAKLGLRANGSHVVSQLDASWTSSKTPQRVRVQVDVRHTYRSDLRVMLVSPTGRRMTLFNRKGGGDNDLSIDETLEIPVRERSKAVGSWTLVVSDFAGLDVGTLRRWSVRLLGAKNKRGKLARSGAPLPIPDAPTSGGAASMHRLAIAAPRISTLTARLGRVALVKAHQFSRLEIDMAKQLRPLPKKAQVVFVMDLSRSLDEDEVTAQLELARGYLSHIPDASFAVVGYARHARLLAGFKGASRAGKVLDGLAGGAALRLHNGSSMDRGLRKAVDILRSRRGPKRIVLLTDALLRPSWNNRDAIAHLPRGRGKPIVHVVVPDSGGNLVATRKDGHALYPIAKRTGGILQTVDGLRSEQRKSIPELVLGLVRPTRIDNVSHNGPNELPLPKTLEEGEAVREMLELGSAPRALVVRGQIWSRPYRKVIRARGWFNKVTAALIFPADLHGDLSEDEQYRIAMYGRAVSPVTSYLAIEPGVRPSTAGIDRMGGIGSGFGTGSGYGGLGSRRSRISNWRQFYYAAIRRCRAKHGSKKPLTLIVDTTKLETVDVEVRGVTGAMKSCAIEAGWRVELPHYNKVRDKHTLWM